MIRLLQKACRRNSNRHSSRLGAGGFRSDRQRRGPGFTPFLLAHSASLCAHTYHARAHSIYSRAAFARPYAVRLCPAWSCAPSSSKIALWLRARTCSDPYALMLCQAWSSVIMLREQHSCLSVPLLRREQHHRWPLCQLLQHGLSTDMLTAPPFHLNSGVVFGAAGLA